MREESNVAENLIIPGNVTAPLTRTKRIPPELRRRRINFSVETKWYKRILWRLKEDSQFLRTVVQLAFVLLCTWIGIEFYLFLKWGMSAGTENFVSRPPGVEGFLPISALISLKYWLMTSIINTVHPSAFFILLAIIITSVVLKKSFCSWLCPIGTLSESLWLLGEKIFGKNIHLPRWLDYPLRSLKYLLLSFFVWAIVGMDVPAMAAFINSPYNKLADVKMYLFFATISTFALWTIIVFMLLSTVVKNFWCRFLCPYGALLGIAGWFSPFKITREKSTCIDCNLCTEACPADIKVHAAERIWSDECTSCMRCVEVCPVKNTLTMKTSFIKQSIPNWVFGVLVVGVFMAVTGLAMLTGHWDNSITKEEYAKRIQEIDSPLYQH
jgi:polyferredoxin